MHTTVFNIDNNNTFFLSNKSAYYNDSYKDCVRLKTGVMK